MSSQRETSEEIEAIILSTHVQSDDYPSTLRQCTKVATDELLALISHQATEHELKVLKELLGEPDLKGNIQWRIAGLEATLEGSK